MNFSFRVVILFGTLVSGFAHANDNITVSFNERPPYLTQGTDGAASGLIGTAASEAFKAAGLEVTWSKVPPNRQLIVVKEGGNNCAIGWFKTPERTQFAKFTNPIYRDKPTIILTNTNFEGKDGSKLSDLLTAKGVRVLVKENFSYGGFIDGKLESLKPTLVKSNGTPSQMLQLIHAHTADFMFASEEESKYLIEQSGVASNSLKQLKAADMPNGEFRYIMCSNQVPDSVISRLNKVIKFK